MGATSGWPALRAEDWTETRDALHLWTQVVGKVKLAKAPAVNHWWHVTLTLTPRGLTTGPIPDDGRTFEMTFDLVDHVLRIEVAGGERREVALEPTSVAAFHAATMAALAELGIEVAIWTMPVELETVVAFDADDASRPYDRASVEAFLGQLSQADRVLRAFRGRFAGKSSPVHFFWGAFDLAVTRFSGRSAPRHPGGAPNCADWVMEEGYSHELASFGFWPAGGGDEGAFYAYAYPQPDGYAARSLRPEAATYAAELGEFVLPYEAVRGAGDPDAALLAFLQDAYEAARDLAGWDRALDYAPIGPG